MNISTDSKIYKLLKFFDTFSLTSWVVPKNYADDWEIYDLCALVRSLTFGFLFLFFLLITPVLWVWVLVYNPEPGFLSVYSVLSLLISLLGLFIMALATIAIPYLIEKIGQFNNYLRNRNKSEDSVNSTAKNPSTFKVFIQYCVDKHNKVCRSVSFKDTPKDD